MAPVGKVQAKKNHLQLAIAIGQQLIQKLQDGSSEELQVRELEATIENLANIPGPLHNNDRRQLDTLGTSLWNGALRKNNDLLFQKKASCLVRTLATLLIETAQRDTSGHPANDMRVLRCATKASRLCCDKGELSLAEINAEKAAMYIDRVSRKHERDDVLVSELRNEYLLLRIILAWRQGRLDFAKTMYQKLKNSTLAVAPRQVEQLSDLLYEIGKDQLRLSRAKDAIYWLDAAHDEISAYDVNQLSYDARELKATILHAVAKALMQDDSGDNPGRLENVVKDLEMEGDEKLPILLLKLDVLAHTKEAEPSEYFHLLQRLVQTVHMTDTNIKTLLHHIHVLRGLRPVLAHDLLLELIHSRLIDSQDAVWMQKATITLLWIATSSADLEDSPGSVYNLLDQLHGLGSWAVLEAGAAQTAHVLLWKTIESCQHARDFERAETWCQVALHKSLLVDGCPNKAKFERKLLQVQLSQAAPLKARESYNQLSTSVQCEPLTQFLLFKIALSVADNALAEGALSSICRAIPENSKVIFACILEAQQAGSQEQSLVALLHLLRQYKYDVPGEVRGPALIRCTARMLLQQITKDSTYSQQHVNDLCEVFEAAATQARRCRPPDSESAFSVAELDWFSRNTYNLALKQLPHWPYSATVRVIDACTTFTGQYPEDLEPSALEDLQLRRTFCNFVSASLYTAMARCENALEVQLQHYIAARKAVEAFRSLAPAQMQSLPEAPRQDLRRKYTSLVAYDYEAAARLKCWDAMESVIKECQEQSFSSILPILADITIVAEAPNSNIVKLLQLIINGAWNGQSNDLAKLARWMRCLLMLTVPQELETAEKLLEQALAIAQSTKEKPREEAYPSDELHWLATTAFNIAIEMHAGGQLQMSRRWIEHALQLASLDPEGDQIYQQMQENHQKLVWSEE